MWYNAQVLLGLRNVISVRKVQVGTFEEVRYALHDFAQILQINAPVTEHKWCAVLPRSKPKAVRPLIGLMHLFD